MCKRISGLRKCDQLQTRRQRSSIQIGSACDCTTSFRWTKSRQTPFDWEFIHYIYSNVGIATCSGTLPFKPRATWWHPHPLALLLTHLNGASLHEHVNAVQVTDCRYYLPTSCDSSSTRQIGVADLTPPDPPIICIRITAQSSLP
ncbi:hypothetical protein ECG_08123 [Echinococcus granulosus]|nr:hypothetical protein ECG_08123 [Echinococcus granulosus]